MGLNIIDGNRWAHRMAHVRPRRNGAGLTDVPLASCNQDQFSYEVDWSSLDELIDQGLTTVPVRGLPPAWVRDCVDEADKLLSRYPRLTVLRACELAISVVYRRRDYSPSYNSDPFPERIVADAL